MGSERKTAYISDEVKRMTAYHEVIYAYILMSWGSHFSFRVGMPLWRSTQTALCPFTRLHAYHAVTHSVWWVLPPYYGFLSASSCRCELTDQSATGR